MCSKFMDQNVLILFVSLYTAQEQIIIMVHPLFRVTVSDIMARYEAYL